MIRSLEYNKQNNTQNNIQNITQNNTQKEYIQNNYELLNDFPTGLLVCKVEITNDILINENEIASSNNVKNFKIILMNKITKNYFGLNEEYNEEEIIISLKKFEEHPGNNSKNQISNFSNLYLDIINFYPTEDSIYTSKYFNGDKVILVHSTLVKTHFNVNNTELDDVNKNELIFHKLISIENFSDERRLLQNSLYKNLRSQFILTISHELNNPLNGLLHYSEKLIKDRSFVKKNKYFDKIKRFKFCIKFFIKNLTLSSKMILKEKINLNPININLVNLFHGTIQKFNPFFESKEIKYKVDLKEMKNVVIYYDYEYLKFFLKNVFMYVCYKLEDNKNFLIESEINKEKKTVTFNLIKHSSNKAIYQYSQRNKSEKDISFNESITVINSIKTEEMLREILETLSVYLRIKFSHSDFNKNIFLKFELKYKEIEKEINQFEDEADVNEFSPFTTSQNNFKIDIIRRSMEIENSLELFGDCNSKFLLPRLNSHVNQSKINLRTEFENQISINSFDENKKNIQNSPEFYKHNNQIDEVGIRRLKRFSTKNLKFNLLGSIKKNVNFNEDLFNQFQDEEEIPNYKKREEKINSYRFKPLNRISEENLINKIKDDEDEIRMNRNIRLIKRNSKNEFKLEVIKNDDEDEYDNIKRVTSKSFKTYQQKSSGQSIFNFNIDLNVSIMKNKKDKQLNKLCYKNEALTKLRDNSKSRTLPIRELFNFVPPILLLKRKKSNYRIEDPNRIMAPLTPVNRTGSFHCNCKRILIVDDENFNINVLKYILKSYKLIPETCSNGKEAVSKVNQNFKKECCDSNYKLVFMDVMMPVMDGIEASIKIQELCNQNNYNSMNVVIISAHDGDAIYQKIKQIKLIKEFVTKPVKKSKIEELLNKYYYDL